jgi:hypothetical protein
MVASRASSFKTLKDRVTRLFARAEAGTFRILAPADHWGKSGSRLSILNPESGELIQIELSLELAHAAFVNPKKKNQAIVMGQHKQACLVDLSEGQIIKEIDAEDYFYGHGAFTPDGELFYASEVHGSGNCGRISVRRSDTLEVLDEMPSFGPFPHDFVFLSDGHTMAIANHGIQSAPGKIPHASSLTYVDTRSKKLMGQVKIPEPEAFASHMQLLPNDEILLGTRKQVYDGSEAYLQLRAELANPDTYLAAIKEIWKYMKYVPAPMYWIKGEKILREEKFSDFYPHALNTLSFAYAPKLGVIAITHVEGKMISFWDVKTRKLKKTLLPGKEPRGICVGSEGRDFAVTFTEGFIQRLDGQTLELDPALKHELPFGVHITAAKF